MDPFEDELHVRKRRKISIACVACRQKHEKCDGTHPCKYCTRRGFECVYPPPKKRGPQPGMRRKLKQQMESLNNELEKQRAHNEVSQKIIRDLTMQLNNAKKRNRNGSYILPPPTSDIKPFSSYDIVHDNTEFTYYLDAVQTWVKTVFGGITNIDLKAALSKECTAENCQIYAMMSIGAHTCGQIERAQQLFKIAKGMSSSILENPSFAGANAYLLMGMYYMYNGQIETYEFFVSIAFNMCSLLTRDTKTAVDPNARMTFRTAQICVAECPRIFDYETRVHLLKTAISDLRDKAVEDLSATELTQLFMASSMRVILEVDYALINGSFPSDVAQSECMLTLVQIEDLATKVRNQGFFTLSAQSIRAKFYLAMGYADNAKQMADAVAASMQSMAQIRSDWNPTYCCIMKNVMDVHTIIGGDEATLQKDLDVLEKIGKTLLFGRVVAAVLRKAINNKARSFDICNHVSYCETNLWKKERKNILESDKLCCMDDCGSSNCGLSLEEEEHSTDSLDGSLAPSPLEPTSLKNMEQFLGENDWLTGASFDTRLFTT